MRSRLLRTIALSVVVTGLTVTLDPVDDMNSGLGEKAVQAAWGALGRPYRFTSTGPREFDCSGLVRYCYRAEGLDLPHGTKDLMRIAHVVPRWQLRKGDLLFFQERGRDYSHVAIYAGENRFIHAASSGKAVRVDTLLDPYWKERFLDARRL